MGNLNPVEALNFFQASLFQLLKLEIHCDDHLSLSDMLLLSVNQATNLALYCHAQYSLT